MGSVLPLPCLFVLLGFISKYESSQASAYSASTLHEIDVQSAYSLRHGWW